MQNIDHTKTKARSPQANGICERFDKTLLTGFYQVALRKKVYRSIEALQADLDVWMRDYNTVRLQHRANASGALVLWQDTDADVR